MKTLLLLHTHRFGVTPALIVSASRTIEKLAREARLDFEPSRDESVDVIPVGGEPVATLDGSKGEKRGLRLGSALKGRMPHLRLALHTHREGASFAFFLARSVPDFDGDGGVAAGRLGFTYEPDKEESIAVWRVSRKGGGLALA